MLELRILLRKIDLAMRRLGGAARSQIPQGTVIDPSSPQSQAAKAQLVAQAGTAANNDLFSYFLVGAIVVAIISLLLPGKTT